MNAYALDLLNDLDDRLIADADAVIDYGSIRKKKHIAVSLAGAVAATVLLYICFPAQQNISVSLFADDGKVQITEDGTRFFINTISETSILNNGLFEIKIEAAKKTRLLKISRWENGDFVGTVDYSEETFYHVNPGGITINQEIPLSQAWGFTFWPLWENHDVDPLEEILKFEFEDGTVIHKKITVKAVDEKTWFATFEDIKE